MERKERLSAFNRKNILDIAKQLFLEKGITHTSMDDIAKKAQYSKSTIYVYFKSKEEILDYITLEYISLLKDGISEALNRSPEFPDGYFAICNTLANFYDSYPLYFENILGEIKIVQDESNEVLFQIYLLGEQINHIIERYIKACVSKGQIRPDLEPIPQTAFALWAGICGIISLANKKEKYLSQAMQVSKEAFMKNGFALLLQSLLPKEE